MTEKEAIYILRNASWLGPDADRQKVEEAVEVVAKAIEALNNSEIPNSSDCIDRAEAQTAIQFAARRYTVAHEAHGEGHVVWSDILISVTDAMNALREVPPAHPENDWIPCTKKAHPDTPFRVQVQMDNGWIITAYYQDGEWLSVPDCGKPLLDKWIEAWRELPEPYQESEQDEH